MPNTFTKYILNTNDEIYNFLNDVNYGMSKPQFHHLSSIVAGLVNVSGDKTISKIAQTIADAKDRSCIYKFLSKSKWDEQLIDRNRLNYLNLRFVDLIKPKTTGFLIIDDTVNIKESAKKIQGLAYNYSHSEGKSVWSHCVVTSNFVAGSLSIPLQYQPYYSNDNCLELNKPFKSKIEIAKDFIENFKKPSNCEKIYYS